MIENAIKQIIEYIGDNPDREGLKNTPQRVINSYKTLFSGYSKDPNDIVTFFSGDEVDEMIICKDIEFYSMCEHHMMPFFGKVHIGYIPNGKIIGLSKIPRLVEIFSRRLQNQERLTQEIVHSLDSLLSAKGTGVVIEAKHLCVMQRGVEKQGMNMTTSSVTGTFKSHYETRMEFLRLIK